MDVDIIDYMGLIEGGVLVLISLCHNGRFYEATIFYSEKEIVLTVDSELEQELGPIEEWHGYEILLKRILSKLIPYEEVKSRLDPVDFSKTLNNY